MQRKMRARSIMVGAVFGQQMAKMALPQHEDMVEALASDRSDQPFNMTVLPRRARRYRPIANAHGSQPACDGCTIRRVTVSNEIARRFLPWKGFGDLPGDPLGGWIRRRVGPNKPSSLQAQDHQPVRSLNPIVGTTNMSTLAMWAA
jgi:hypothetical protein